VGAAVAKVTISLSNDTLQAIERVRRTRRQSRSEFIRQAVEQVLREEQEQQAIARYLEGYRQQPEIAEEVQAIHRMGSPVLVEEPWE